MSRAFIKNDEADEPVLVPARAPLPPGVQNYVTPRGLALLGGSIAALHQRIASAKIVDPGSQPRDSVRFGATVTLTTLEGHQPGAARRFTIVGVDETAAEGRVAFTSPLAHAILGRAVGEQVTLETAQGDETLRIDAIEYGG